MTEKNETYQRDYQREVSCFFVPESESGILSITTNNQSCAVEFDFFSIWEELKEIGSDNYDYVWMLHSHPPGIESMSLQDSNMVYGWVQAIGKPVLFSIITESSLKHYLCKRNIDNKSKVERKVVDLSFRTGCFSYFYLLRKTIYGLSTDPDNITQGHIDLSIKFLNLMMDRFNINVVIKEHVLQD